MQLKQTYTQSEVLELLKGDTSELRRILDLKDRYEEHADLAKFYKGKSLDRLEEIQDGYSRGFVAGVKAALKAYKIEAEFIDEDAKIKARIEQSQKACNHSWEDAGYGFGISRCRHCGVQE